MEKYTPESSNIAHIHYDEATQVLTVTFKSGGVFAYNGVPFGEADKFINNPVEGSVGKHFAKHIKGQYSSEALAGNAAPAAPAAQPAQAPSQEVSIIDNALDEVKQVKEVLRSNQTRVAKAIEIGRKIMADLKANGGKMTPELFERMKKYQINCSSAKTDFNEARKPHTTALNLIIKAFTECENALDNSKPGTVAAEIQKIMNDYAADIHKQEQERQRLIKLQQDKEQEAINLKAECKKRLLTFFGAHLQEKKLMLNSYFNATTLATFDERSEYMKVTEPVYAYAHFQTFSHGLVGRMHTPAEIETLFRNVIEPSFTELAEQYKKEMSELKMFLIDRLPSKKQELESIKAQEEEMERQRQEQERIRQQQQQANNEQERQRLQAQQQENERKQRELEAERKRQAEEQRQREENERQRLEAEAQQRQQEQQQEIESKKAVEQTMSLFNGEVATASTTIEKPETRTGYEIEVLGVAGWMEIFRQWFTIKGMTLDNEKIAGTKLDSMKTYCEGLANKDESKKIQSGFLRYNETFKAVNRKQTNKAA